MSANPFKSVGPREHHSQQEICDFENSRMLADPKGRRDVHWYVHNGEIKIGWNYEPGNGPKPPSPDVMDRKGQPMSWADTEKLNARLAHLGAWARYRPDGSRYDPETGVDRPLAGGVE